MKRVTQYSFLLILLCVIKFSLLPAQNSSIESLQNLAESLTNDTIRIATLIEFSQKYQDTEPDKAFNYGFQALVLATHLDFPKGKARAHNNLGDLYWYKADYISSAEHYHEALEIFENHKDLPAIAECYRNIGWIYDVEGKKREALHNHSKALLINQELGLLKQTSQNHNDMGINYFHLNIVDSAMENFCEAITIQERILHKEGLAAAYGNIGTLYNSMGNTWEAIDNLLQSLKISEEIGNKRYMCDTYSILSLLYLKDSNYTEAIALLEKACVMANELNDKALLKKNYQSFADLYALKKDYQKAFDYINRSLELSDTIFEDGNRRQHYEMIVKYESNKKMLALTNLLKDKKIVEEKLSREKKSRLYLMSFSLMVVVFAFVLYRNNSQKQKMNLALEHASAEIEEKNKSITDSILYSKHIQDVCMPSEQLKNELFKEIFILFQPKDIVSGDFYWYNEKNGKKLIACCDCTGHGVPGALMSMIGNNILNKIVNEKGLTAPDDVLNRLNYEIRKTLKQDDQAASKDGMDIALVTFNSPTEIEYAGANRPLWVVKQNKPAEGTTESDNAAVAAPELVEVKPDKLSIGGYQAENVKPFKKQTLQVSKGDCLYIFSDGYPDQFGGENGKRFTTKRFKELLMANAHKPIKEQEIVLKTAMKEWKGELEQIDDILLIGVKV